MAISSQVAHKNPEATMLIEHIPDLKCTKSTIELSTGPNMIEALETDV